MIGAPSEPTTNEATFEMALAGLRATGASEDTRQLVEFLARHEVGETELINRYEELTEADQAKWSTYLLELILEDERRHHRILAEIASSLAWGGLAPDVSPSVPPLGVHRDPDLAREARRLRQIEEHDEYELRKLRKRFRAFAGTTMWALLIDLMLLDTKKHAAILLFLEGHARTP
jgi:hypothetical protein